MGEQIYLHKHVFFKKTQGVVILYNIYDYESRLKMHVAVSRLLEDIDGKRTIEELATRYDEQNYEPIEGFHAKEILKYLLVNDFLTTNIENGKLPELEQKTPPIDLVNMRITNSCNFSCKHCFPNSSIQNKSDLTYEEIIDIITELAKYKVLHLTLTGGEPFLNKNLLDIVEYANSKGIIVSVCTNTSLVKDEDISRLSKCALGAVEVSMDGASAETHDSCRGKGKYDKLIPQIHKLVDAKVPVCLNTVISRFNFHEYKKIIEKANELKVKVLCIDTIRKIGRASTNWQDIGLTYEEKLEFNTYYRSLFPKHGDVILGAHIFALIYKDIIEDEHLNKACGSCLSTLIILANGDMTSCWRLYEINEIAGNIRENSLDYIWNNSELLKKIRSLEISSVEKCKDCAENILCDGSCRAFALANHGDWYGEPDDERCRFSQELNSALLSSCVQ